MSLWNWKTSGWINLTLTILLIMAISTSICSAGIRSGFQTLTPNFSFNTVYPEAGLFNFLLFCSSIFGFVSVCLRYSYLMDQIQVMPTSVNYINKFAVSMGIISFLGLTILASFPASSLQKVTSFKTMGEYMFIGVGVIFTILQVLLTYTSSRYSLLFLIRLLLAATLLSTFLSSIVFIEKGKAEHSFSNSSISNDSLIILFVESSANVALKQENVLIACILEWTSVFVYALFYLSFFQEFQTISAYVIMRPFINYRSNDFRSSSLTVNERI